MKKDLAKILDIFKSFFTFLFFVIITAVVIGSFIYVLYRAAVYSRKLYSLVFIACAVLMAVYFIFRAIRKGVLSSILLRIVRSSLSCIFVACIIAVFVLYGGFIVRFPLFGGICAPFIIFIALYFLPRLHFFSRMKRYFS